MPKVPEYQSDVQARPIFRQGLEAQATPDAFGASIGRGMTGLAQGVSNLGDSITAVRDLEDTMRAKDADNAYSDWLRERMYGDNGYMTTEGRNAVDARKGFEGEAEQKRKEFGQGLTPGAAKSYQTASQARLQTIYQQSIIHSANERKAWFKDSSTARVSTFADDALVNYTKPQIVTKNIAAGLMELREQGHMAGWDEDTQKSHEADFVSGIHKNIALRLAQDDPLAADKYMRDHSDNLSGADQYSLKSTLDTEIKSEKSKREADAILSAGRTVSQEGPADPAPAAVKPAGKSIAGRTLGSEGPTKARAFLTGKTNKGSSSVDNLDASFATNLAALMQDAPPGIREGLGIYSGFRSIERQKELYAKSDKSGHMVARPGHSQHNFGRAVDLSYNGQSLSRAPQEVRNWVHENARKYGMYFPMSYEPWHIEPVGSRDGKAAAVGGGSFSRGSTVQAGSNVVAPRTLAPSYDEIEAKLAAISDPDVRDLTRKRVYSMMEASSKADEQREKAAKTELWRYVDQGQTPDQVPMEVRQAAGMSAVSSAWSYIDTAAKGRAVDSDQTLLYDMRRFSASDPTEFANVDLNDYRDRLSKEDIKELTDKQSGALTDMRKAREDGLNLTAAFSQADSQLASVGITMTGKEGSAREDAAKRVAQFQNALAAQMEEFKRTNENRAPTQVDIQSMINRLLLPVVIKTPGTLWGTNDTPGFAFDARTRPDNSTVEFDVKYSDIPIDLRQGIAIDLERELGRKPSDQEVVKRYLDFTESR